MFHINPIHLIASFLWDTASSAEPGQTPPDAASDQVLHCLLLECPIYLNIIKNANTIQQPLKQKWTGPIDNSGKFHSA